MKIPKPQAAEPEKSESREELRELAEALSLYRSAVTHLAGRASALPRPAVQRSAASSPYRWLLGPVLGAAVAAAFLFPLYARLHHPPTLAPQAAQSRQDQPPSALASIDDTVLMNQIDSDLSESVPDALQPLADLSTQSAAQQAASQPVVPEKNQ